MRTIELGRSGIFVPPLIIGGNVFGWTADRKESFRVLDAALDAGLNAIDTADIYSWWAIGNHGGESETIIGEWVSERSNRHKIVIATKVGAEGASGRKGLQKEAITNGIDASLRRLKTDYIDLYQAHRDDPNTPLEETLNTFGSLVKSGKARAIGASNYTSARSCPGVWCNNGGAVVMSGGAGLIRLSRRRAA